jgi:hypothetical protein
MSAQDRVQQYVTQLDKEVRRHRQAVALHLGLPHVRHYREANQEVPIAFQVPDSQQP